METLVSARGGCRSAGRACSIPGPLLFDCRRVRLNRHILANPEESGAEDHGLPWAAALPFAWPRRKP